MMYGYVHSPTKLPARMDKHLCAVLYIFLMCLSVDVIGQHECDKVVSSYKVTDKKGTFQSPGYGSHYPNGVNCKYKFIGKPNERVKIQFMDFRLQGRPPRCAADFVTIYSQLEHESDDLLEARDTGPFCGSNEDDHPIVPKLVVSTHNILVIWFYSNHEKGEKGFMGTWEFIDAIHEEMGTVDPLRCGYTIRSENKASGYIMSPTYPGAYPDELYCFYKLQGKPGQRIRLIFEDFSLFYGGAYCPFDYLRIFDGYTNTDRQIGNFCGTYNKSTVIYSSGEALRLHFVTGKGRRNFSASPMQNNADYSHERKGFKISYLFSDKFVALDSHFVLDGARHILGTQCDLHILSNKTTNGTFVSPSHPAPFPEGVVCKYYLDGLQDDQNLEKVKVMFFEFSIPGNMPYCELGWLSENENELGAWGNHTKYCGSKLNPPVLTSSKARMVITLNTTGAVQGGKFLARYQFITDYNVPGEQIEEGKCKFHYISPNYHSYHTNKINQGVTNSPRFPDIYPLRQHCEYIFRPKTDKEFVMIHFDVFRIQDSKRPKCNRNGGDYISFEESLGSTNKNYTFTEVYCGNKHIESGFLPPPYVTSRLLKMVFHSDAFGENDRGFKAEYKFLDKLALDHEGCSSGRIRVQGGGGIITSPLYPRKYPDQALFCEWVVTASRNENKILVQIAELNMEGQNFEDGIVSCPEAALRLYDDPNSIVHTALICGKSEDGKKVHEGKSYISKHNSFKISFLSSDNLIGAKGFKITYTEVLSGFSATSDCAGFQCHVNKFCISKKLKCNGEPNCGEGDSSDETAECSGHSIRPDMFGLGSSLSVVLGFILFFHTNIFQL